MVKFDCHYALEGRPSPLNDAAFALIGYRPDALTENHVTYSEGTPMAVCAMTGAHGTIKYDHLDAAEAKHRVMEDLRRTGELMERLDVVGYAHAEITVDARDLTLRSAKPLDLWRPWPVERFDAAPSEENKKWDIHVAIPLSKLPPELEAALDIEKTGLYYIGLTKTRSGVTEPFRVYTIQGTCPVTEGQKLFDALVEWFRDVGAPHVEIKQETYLGMVRVGAPHIVPPTISAVRLLPRPDVARGPLTFE